MAGHPHWGPNNTHGPTHNLGSQPALGQQARGSLDIEVATPKHAAPSGRVGTPGSCCPASSFKICTSGGFSRMKPACLLVLPNMFPSPPTAKPTGVSSH